MQENKRVDPFVDEIIGRIDPKIRASLTPNQLLAISKAIKDPNPIKHPIDIRGVIPLYFARYFFVFMVGRDRRSASARKEQFRRRQVTWAGLIMFAFLISVPFLLVVFFFLYMLKLFAGVDVLPDFHLWDLFE